jgi:hypothetical protein
MINETMTETEYGKLIYPEFYGRGVDFRRSGRSGRIRTVFGMIGFNIFYIFFCWWMYQFIPYFQTRIAIYVGISGMIIMDIYHIYHGKKVDAMPIVILNRSGELDWDLYDNGMLVKQYSEDLPGNIERKFIRFDGLAKVYINIGKNNAQEIMDAMKKMDRKRPDFKDEGYIADERWIRYFKREIQFVDNNGCVLDEEIEKEYLDDAKRFESIIRQKVKAVE